MNFDDFINSATYHRESHGIKNSKRTKKNEIYFSRNFLLYDMLGCYVGFS